jgi:hypothetical protein
MIFIIFAVRIICIFRTEQSDVNLPKKCIHPKLFLKKEQLEIFALRFFLNKKNPNRTFDNFLDILRSMYCYTLALRVFRDIQNHFKLEIIFFSSSQERFQAWTAWALDSAVEALLFP